MDSPDDSLDAVRRWALSAPLPRELTADTVDAQRDLMRGILVARLEQLWDYCQRNMEPPSVPRGVEDLRGPDPRYGELGLRVLDRLTRLYRVLEAAPGGDRGGAPEDREYHLGRVLSSLTELEARRGG